MLRKTAVKTVWVLVTSITLSLSANGSTIIQVDQMNPGPFTATNGALAPYNFGQSFIPTLPAIDAIEFLLGGTAGSAVIDLRQGVVGLDGLGGTLVAQSLPTFVNVIPSALFQFNFPTRVTLTPGTTYVAEIVITAGEVDTRETQGNAYARGQFLSQGF